MKKIKFEFVNSFEGPVIETFDFEDDVTEQEIDKEFNSWFFNQLDMCGIEGNYEEVEE